jgi:hypothetical protein
MNLLAGVVVTVAIVVVCAVLASPFWLVWLVTR